jgi:hypothetical protein
MAKIKILSSEIAEASIPEFGAMPSPKKVRQFVEEEVNSEEVQAGLLLICNEFQVDKIDPEKKLGIDEIELAFVLSGKAGVRLIGTAEIGMEASIKIKIKRK